MSSPTYAAGGGQDPLENSSLLDDTNVDTDSFYKSHYRFAVPANDMANLFLLSVAFFFLFTPFNGLLSIESTLNEAGKLGPTVMGTFFVVFAVVCVAAPVLIRMIGLKGTMIGSSGFICVFIVAHFHPKWGTLLPAAVAAGLWMALMFASQSVYLSKIAYHFAEQKNEHLLAYLGLFNGVFYFFLQATLVFGNVLSAAFLQNGITPTSVHMYGWVLPWVCVYWHTHFDFPSTSRRG
jgi:hypothetical protein